MSKPLELVIYDRNDDGDYLDSHWASGRRFVIALGDVEVFAMDKRLTDAELAAEVFSAIFHEAECEVRGMRIERTWPAHPRVEHYVTQNHEFGRQAGILERFATLPHYDEVDE